MKICYSHLTNDETGRKSPNFENFYNKHFTSNHKCELLCDTKRKSDFYLTIVFTIPPLGMMNIGTNNPSKLLRYFILDESER